MIPHYINGRRREPARGQAFSVTSPVDGSLLGEIHAADQATVDETVAAAQTAFGGWSRLPVKARVQVLYRFKHLVEQNLGGLAELAASESGKTKEEAEAGILKGIEVVEYAASLPQLIGGEILEVSAGIDCHSRRYPLGVVAGITPFNFPAMVPMWMFPLALACGNTFILKPSEQVSLTPLRLADLLTEAGLPPGVFNVLTGARETVEAVLDHPGVAAVAFVGSTAVARQVHARGTSREKRVLALGGAKNHLVILPDADPDATAKNIIASAFGCAGQRCMAASALLALPGTEGILDRIEAYARKIRVGEDMGAIVSAKAQQRIIGYIDRAAARGLRLRVDGRNAAAPGKPGGYYVGPTLIDQVPATDECACDEIFGPVLSIVRVDSLDQALAIENRSPYGNAASLFTRDGAAAAHFEHRANAGMIGINIGVPVPREPFSFGGWNDSRFGVGDITGRDALSFWTKTKKVTRKWTAAAGQNWMS
jgi:malonate-semialdehyde dehydrogenase (acetylating)/methylmalonate-semialdehyde dehydrogenase